MLCKKCGAELETDAKFCPECGAEVVVSETVETPKKKSKVKFIIAACVAVLILVIGFTKGSALANTVKKLVSSPEEYYQWVEKKQLEDTVETFTHMYEDYLLGAMGAYDQNSSQTLSFELGEGAEDLLDLLDAAGADITWLKSGKLTVNSNVKNNVTESGIGFNLNGEKFADVKVIMDWNEELLYAGIPSLSASYLSADMDEFMSDYDMEAMLTMMNAMKSLDKSLPKAAKLNKLLDKYIDMALECLDKVEMKEDEKISAVKVSQKCTKLEVTIEEKMVGEMLEKVFEALEEDKEVKEIITSVCEALDDTKGLDLDVDADDVYDVFTEFCSYMADEAADEFDDDGEILMVVYVDGDGKVIGREFSNKNADKKYNLKGTVDVGYAYDDGFLEGRKTAVACENFYEATGIPLFFYTVDEYDNSLGDCDEYTLELYDKLFQDENHVLIAYYNSEDWWSWSYGKDVSSLMADDEINDLIDEIDRYWYDNSLSNDALFAKGIENYQDSLIKKDTSITLSVLCPQDGSKHGYEFSLEVDGETYLALEGSGKESGGKLTGDFALEVEGKEYFTFSVQKLDLDKMKNGYWNGTVSMNLSENIENVLTAYYQNLYESSWYYSDYYSDYTEISAYREAKEILKIFDEISISVTAEMSKSKSAFTLTVMNDDEKFGSISLASESGSGKKVSLPSDKKTIEVSDVDDLEDWWDTLEWKNFTKAIKEMDLPSRAEDIIEEITEADFDEIIELLDYIW